MPKKARSRQRRPTYKKVLLFAGGAAVVAVIGVGYVRYSRPESDFEKWKRNRGSKKTSHVCEKSWIA